MVGLEKNYPLWTAVTWRNHQFGPVLCTTLPFEQSHPERATKIWPTERELCSIMIMRGHTHLWWLGINWRHLVRNFWCIHHIASTLHHMTTICFGLCKILLMVKNWLTETSLKITWLSFSTINHGSSTTMELWSYPKNGKGS